MRITALRFVYSLILKVVSVFKKFCWRVDRLSTAMKYTKTEIWGLLPEKQKKLPPTDFYSLSN